MTKVESPPFLFYKICETTLSFKKIEVNKIPNDRLDGVIRTMIKDLEKRKDKAMKRSDTDDFWIKIESLQWVLFVIYAIKNERMVVI